MSDSPPLSPHGLRPAGPVLPKWFCAHGWLLAAMLLATFCEVFLVARSPIISRDGVVFIQMAQQLPDGVREAFRKHDQHPGYPAMILATRSLLPIGSPDDNTTQWITAARAVAGLCGVLLVPVVWAFARELFGDPVPNVAAMLAATLPALRQNAADALSDTPHLLFWLTACLLACIAVRTWRVRWFAAAALVSALAYWIRPEGLSVAIVLCAVAPIVAWRTRTTTLPRLVLCVTTAAVVAVVAIAPYSLMSSKFLTSKQDPMAKPEPVLPYVVRRAQAATESAAAAEHPADGPSATTTKLSVIVRTFGDGTFELVAESMKSLRYVLVPIFLAGCLFVAIRRPPLGPFLVVNALGLMHASLLMLVYFMSGYISHRHVLPLAILALPACGVGLTHLGVWLSTRLHMAPRRGVAVAALAVMLMVAPWTLRKVNYTYDHVLEVARWIDANTPPGAVVASNSRLMPFYAGRTGSDRHASVPTVEDAIAADAAHSCDYVVVDEMIETFNPAWYEQLTGKFKLVKEITPSASSRYHSRTAIYAARREEIRTTNSRSSDVSAHGGRPDQAPAVTQRPVADTAQSATSAAF